jgi:hypothetical protein
VSWFALLIKYFTRDEIEVDEMGKALIMYKGKKCIRVLVGKSG